MDSLVRPLNPKKIAFGRHETFALRYSWLTKGFQAFQDKSDIFTLEEATVQLGVGKNMVNAIRYWLCASQILEKTSEGLKATEIGVAIFSEQGWDPYLEDEATLWLIHWLLATNAELSTAWYWFFNCFHKAVFINREVENALIEFATENFESKFSSNTLTKDIAILLRMYSQSRNNKQTMEDLLDSPLSLLKMINGLDSSKSYQSMPEQRDSLPIAIIGFAVNELFNHLNASEMPIESVMYGKKNNIAIGGVFRLTESNLLAKLELLTRYIPGIFELRETAGINQIYRIQKTESLCFLKKHYDQMEMMVA